MIKPRIDAARLIALDLEYATELGAVGSIMLEIGNTVLRMKAVTERKLRIGADGSDRFAAGQKLDDEFRTCQQKLSDFLLEFDMRGPIMLDMDREHADILEGILNQRKDHLEDWIEGARARHHAGDLSPNEASHFKIEQEEFRLELIEDLLKQLPFLQSRSDLEDRL